LAGDDVRNLSGRAEKRTPHVVSYASDDCLVRKTRPAFIS
jgi:hypothetical protein